MTQRQLNRLLAVYRTFRAHGMSGPDAWRFANDYLIDQPEQA